MEDALVIGIAGGSGSGKTTITDFIRQELGSNVTVIMHDDYYRAHHELTLQERTRLNYDHPDAYETTLLVEHLAALKRGETVQVPVYDFSIYDRTEKTTTVTPSRVIIVEGIMIFAEPELRRLMDVKVFVECDADVRILRRAKRDMLERDRSLESVIEQYLSVVKPMHEAFVEPSKRFADLIVPTDRQNPVALDILMAYIRSYTATSE